MERNDQGERPELVAEIEKLRRKQRNLIFGGVAALAVFAAVVAFVVSVGARDASTKSETRPMAQMPTSTPEKSTHTVEYRLVSSRLVDSSAAPRERPKARNVTVSTPSGTTQVGTQYLPLRSKNGTDGLGGEFNPGSFLYISGQVAEFNSGSVTCEIYVDGVLMAQNTAKGLHSIVTCQATA